MEQLRILSNSQSETQKEYGGQQGGREEGSLSWSAEGFLVRDNEFFQPSTLDFPQKQRNIRPEEESPEFR